MRRSPRARTSDSRPTSLRTAPALSCLLRMSLFCSSSEREKNNRRVVSSIFPLFLLLLCLVKVLPPAKSFAKEFPCVPAAEPFPLARHTAHSGRRCQSPFRPSLHSVQAPLCFARVVELELPMIAGTCCTAAPLVVDCGGTGLYIVNLQWQINSTYTLRFRFSYY